MIKITQFIFIRVRILKLKHGKNIPKMETKENPQLNSKNVNSIVIEKLHHNNYVHNRIAKM